jgi:hypothetical protein
MRDSVGRKSLGLQAELARTLILGQVRASESGRTIPTRGRSYSGLWAGRRKHLHCGNLHRVGFRVRTSNLRSRDLDFVSDVRI